MLSISPEERAEHVTWNAKWEQKLATAFPRGIERRGSIPDRMSPAEKAFLAANLGPHAQLDHQKRMRSVCELQKHLIALAIESFAADELQEKWVTFPLETREEFALEGIWRACHVADFEGFREWCPDLTVRDLAGRSEKGFIQLIKRLIAGKPEGEIRVPILIPNPVVDKLLPLAQDITLHDFVNQNHLSRCYLMTMVMWQIMMALYNIQETYITPRESIKDTSEKSRLRESLKLLPKETVKGLRKLHLIESERRAAIGMVYVCEYCRRPQSSLKEGQQLRACAKCRDIGRAVKYCSRECQTKDWKIGYTVPHKTICALPSFSDLDPDIWGDVPLDITDERVPPPEPPFKRSIALWHQISFLKEPPYADYAVMIAAPEDAVLFNYPDIDGRVAFIVFRQRALRSGDAGAVAFMFKAIAPFARSLGSSREALKTQLQKEYGVDIDSSLDIETKLPTDEEMDAARAVIEKSDT